MSVEEVELGGEDNLDSSPMPHESGYYDQEVQDTPEPELEDTGSEEARTIEIPDDPDEFDEFYASLSDEERKSLDAYLDGQEIEDIDPEAAQPMDNEEEGDGNKDPEGQPELTHDISQEQYDKLPSEVKEYLDSTREKLNKFESEYGEGFQKNLEEFLNDPVVNYRMQVLSGKIQDPASDINEKFLSNSALNKLNIDFDLDPNGSMNRLKSHLASAIMESQQGVHQHYQLEKSQNEYQDKIKGEFSKIQELDNSLKSDLDYSDSNHPMNGFISWLIENEKNINLVNIGGVETYKLYMAKTGKEINSEANVRKEVVRNIAKAKSNAAKTLPKSVHSQGNSDRKIVHGIDVDKFRNDENYQERIYMEHGDNAKMRKLLNSFIYEDN